MLHTTTFNCIYSYIVEVHLSFPIRSQILRPIKAYRRTYVNEGRTNGYQSFFSSYFFSFKPSGLVWELLV